MQWMELRDICRRAVYLYGMNPQLVVAMEECAELQKECAKAYRFLSNRDLNTPETQEEHLKRIALEEHLSEEIADVEIMLMQLKIMFKLDYNVNRYLDIKAERLDRRLNDAGY